MIFSKLTIGFIAGVLLSSASVSMFALNKIGVAYERGRYSVFFDCAQHELSMQDTAILICKAVIVGAPPPHKTDDKPKFQGL